MVENEIDSFLVEGRWRRDRELWWDNSKRLLTITTKLAETEKKPNIVPKLTISSSGLMNRKRPIEEISGEEGDENDNDEQEQQEQEEQQPSTIKLTKW